MNRPEPQPPIAVALEQLKAAARSIARKWRARATKTGDPRIGQTIRHHRRLVERRRRPVEAEHHSSAKGGDGDHGMRRWAVTEGT
jgi:hypothetical protein